MLSWVQGVPEKMTSFPCTPQNIVITFVMVKKRVSYENLWLLFWLFSSWRIKWQNLWKVSLLFSEENEHQTWEALISTVHGWWSPVQNPLFVITTLTKKIPNPFTPRTNIMQLFFQNKKGCILRKKIYIPFILFQSPTGKK